MNKNEIFDVVRILPDGEVDAYLERACGGDQELKQQVLEMLRSNGEVDRTVDVNATCDLPSGEVDKADSFELEPAPTIDSDSDASPVADEDSIRPGDRFGPFKLLQPLGKGGMGEVWMAEQSEPVKRRVALKIIKAGIGSKEILARFEAERQALALMNHPNIARILDAGATPDGQPYFAMELVQGKPLTTYCDENRLSVDERLQLFTSVCSGVQHAHQKGIIHRDLKPGNIIVGMVDGKPVPKVIDFGLAKAMESTQRLTDQSLFTGIGQILGTLKYMSPEQASLDTVDIDTRTDIYALGVILYELLTGVTPLDDASIKGQAALKILEFIRDKEPVRPSSKLGSSTAEEVSTITGQRRTDSVRLNRVLAGDLDWIVMKALDKDRTRRYESASGFAADLQRYLASEPVEARPPSLNYRFRKFVRKNRVGVFAAALVTLALLGGIVGTTLAMVRARSAEKLAEDRLVEADEARKLESEQRKVAEAALVEKEAALESETRQRKFAEAVADFVENDFLALTSVEGQVELFDSNATELTKDATLTELLDRAAEKLSARTDLEPLIEARLCQIVGISYRRNGDAAKGIPFLVRSLDIRKVQLDPEHIDTLVSMNNLALGYESTGQLEKALPLYEQTLELMKAKRGPDHSDTLTCMNNLAGGYYSSGQLDKALSLHEQTLELTKAKLGLDHPDTLTSMSNVASAWVSTGQPDKALPLLKQTLELRRARLGPDHPFTLLSMNNLAHGYESAGQLDKALPLYEQTLEMRRAKLGLDHPDTLISMSNLALGYESAGQLDRALPLLEQTLELTRAKLGPDHPDTLLFMNNLAAAYDFRGQQDKALPLYEQTLELMNAQLGTDHPDTLTCMNNLAKGYESAGRLDKAFPLYEQALELMKAQLGPDHPNTLSSMNNLAMVYHSAGQLDKAFPLYEQSLELMKAQLGPDHPNTLASMNNLAGAFWSAGQLDRSVPLFEELLPILVKKLGREHPNTQFTVANLGVNYRDAGRLDEAIPLLEEAYENSKQIPTLRWVGAQLRTAYVKGKRIESFTKMAEEDLENARKSLAEGSAELANVLVSIGADYLTIGDPVQAEALLSEGLQIRQNVAPDAWNTFNAQSLLGNAILNQATTQSDSEKKNELLIKAEPLLLQGYEELKQRESSIPPQATTILPEALDRLIELYTALDKPEDVATYRELRQQYAAEENGN